MKIIHFAKTNSGGAGIAVTRIHHLLLEMGYDSHLYIQQKRFPTENTSQIKVKPCKSYKYMFKMRVARKLAKLINRKNSLETDYQRFRKDDVYCYNDYDEEISTGFCPDITSQVDLSNVDIIFIHHINSFLNSYDIKHLYEKTHARIIYTMMDMAPVTGGCHYPWDCKAFYTTCFNCPALAYDINTKSHFQLASKAENIAYTHAELMSNSIYDLNDAQKSAIKFSTFWQYYYPVDDAIFIPTHQIKTEKTKFIFSIANFPNDIRKGFTYVLQTLMYLDITTPKDYKIVFLCLNKSCFANYHFDNIEFEEFPFCENVNDLVKVYNKADIFLCTSIEDSCPMMLEEALLCGLPTVSFDIGTAKQFITEGRNGFVTEKYDINTFKRKTFELLFNTPNTLVDADTIHNEMASICGKKVVTLQFEHILSNNKQYEYY